MVALTRAAVGNSGADDIRYIRCQVCDELSKKLHRDVAAIREERPNKKVQCLVIMVAALPLS